MTTTSTTSTPPPAPVADPPATAKEAWFARLARFSARRRKTVMLVWLVATLLAAPLALTLTGALSGAGWEAQGSTSVKVRNELRQDFPGLGAEAAVVVYRQDATVASDPSGVNALVADLQGAPGTAGVVDPLTRPAEAGLVSPDGKTVLSPGQLSAASDADLPVAAERPSAPRREPPAPHGAQAAVARGWAGRCAISLPAAQAKWAPL